MRVVIDGTRRFGCVGDVGDAAFEDGWEGRSLRWWCVVYICVFGFKVVEGLCF